MQNWAEADIHDILRSGSAACTNVLKTEGEKYGSPSPPSTCGQADDLSEVKGSAGLYIRQEDDAVYLTAASYGDILTLRLSSPTRLRSKVGSPCKEPSGRGWPVLFKPKGPLGCRSESRNGSTASKGPPGAAKEAASKEYHAAGSGVGGAATPGEAHATIHT